MMYGLFVLSAMAAAASIAALGDWKAVEVHLEKKVKVDSAETNMAESLEWLERLEKPTSSLLGKLKSKENKSKTEGKLEALRIIAEFNSMITSQQCNSDYYEYRQLVLNAVQKCETCYRLNHMFRVHTRKHAECCQQVNMETYRDLIQNTGQVEAAQALVYIRPFFDRLIYGAVNEGKSEEDLGFEHDKYLEWADKPEILEQIYKRFIQQAPSLHGAAAFYSALEGLDYLVRTRENNPRIVGDITNQTSMSANQLELIFKRHILENCSKFANNFGPSVFDLANQDIKYLRDDRTFEQGGKDVADYYLAWATYATCEHIANQAVYLDYIIGRIQLASQRKTASQK